MADAQEIEKTILARYNEALDLYNKKQYEAVGTFYTENANIMAPDENHIVGRKAVVDACAALGAPFSVLEYEGTDFFELLNDRTAYTTYLQAGKDEKGNKVIFYHQCILWKCVDGLWCLDRELYNARPSTSPTTHEIAKKQIQGRISALYDAFNKDDLDAALDIYVEDATVVPHGANITKGRKAIMELFREVIPQMTKLVDEMYYFELLSDVTAYTNSHMLSLDEGGKVKAAFRDCLLWTKREDEWFVRRDMYNDMPLTITQIVM